MLPCMTKIPRFQLKNAGIERGFGGTWPLQKSCKSSFELTWFRCIILRDRILPLGVRRSIQITRENFDFTTPRLSEKDLEREFESSCVYDAETKRDLARIFLAQLDLAVELTDALSYVYPANGFLSFDKLDYNDLMSMPKKIESCKENLDSWHSRFNECVVPGAWSKKHKSVMLYSGLTSMYFQ